MSEEEDESSIKSRLNKRQALEATKNLPKYLKPILLFHSLAIEFNKVEKYALLMIFFPSQWRVYLMVICNLCKNMTVKEMVV